jgi:hypothetical protein
MGAAAKLGGTAVDSTNRVTAVSNSSVFFTLKLLIEVRVTA